MSEFLAYGLRPMFDKTWVSDGKPKYTCLFCGQPTRMRYPHNDPENGPARQSCGRTLCDQARETMYYAEYYANASAEDVWSEALEEDGRDE